MVLDMKADKSALGFLGYEWAAGTVWAFSVGFPRGSFNEQRIVAFLPKTTCPNAASDGRSSHGRFAAAMDPGIYIPDLLFPLPTHKAELSRRRAGTRRV